MIDFEVKSQKLPVVEILEYETRHNSRRMTVLSCTHVPRLSFRLGNVVPQYSTCNENLHH